MYINTALVIFITAVALGVLLGITNFQSAVILPYRSDGSIYRGVLTFTATKPVEVTLSHRIPIDNATLSQLDVQKHGKLFVRHLTAFTGNISTPSRIIPDYRGGSTSPYFSASIPFAIYCCL
jgi:hypothetical protein